MPEEKSGPEVSHLTQLNSMGMSWVRFVQLALRIQELFGAGKSKSMAILILALLELDLLKQQPLVLWTGDAQQTPGGIARTASNAKRSRQLLLAKKHALCSDRNYYMPSNLAEAMIRLLDDSSNEGLNR